MATPRVAAGVLIRDAAGRILLVKPTYKDGWEIPGGYVEPDESPAAAWNERYTRNSASTASPAVFSSSTGRPIPMRATSSPSSSTARASPRHRKQRRMARRLARSALSALLKRRAFYQIVSPVVSIQRRLQLTCTRSTASRYWRALKSTAIRSTTALSQPTTRC